MTESHAGNAVLAVDESIVYGCHFFTVVSEANVAFFGILPTNRDAVVQALNSGDEPIAVLKANAPPEGTAAVVPLSRLESFDWYSDDINLNLRYFDAESNKSRCEVSVHSSASARTQIIEAIRRMLPSWEIHEARASVLYFGITQLVISAMTLLFCVAIAVAGYASGGPVNADKLANRKARGFAFLLNSVGPTGVIVIGIAVIALMTLWLYFASFKAPMKSVCRPKRDIERLT